MKPRTAKGKTKDFYFLWILSPFQNKVLIHSSVLLSLMAVGLSPIVSREIWNTSPKTATSDGMLVNTDSRRSLNTPITMLVLRPGPSPFEKLVYICVSLVVCKLSVQVRGQLAGVSSPAMWAKMLNSGCQAW